MEMSNVSFDQNTPMNNNNNDHFLPSIGAGGDGGGDQGGGGGGGGGAGRGRGSAGVSFGGSGYGGGSGASLGGASHTTDGEEGYPRRSSLHSVSLRSEVGERQLDPHTRAIQPHGINGRLIAGGIAPKVTITITIKIKIKIKLKLILNECYHSTMCTFPTH